jgi:hypothetical protein
MRKFNFFRGYQRVNSDQYNGVTNQYLIQLSVDIISYTDWVYSTMLTIDDETGLDLLIIEFTDIDGSDYLCRISEDGSFKITEIITLPNGMSELLASLDISDEVLSDVENLLHYLQNMPKTIASSL